MFVDVVLVKVPQDTAPAGIAVLIGESESSLARIFLLLRNRRLSVSNQALSACICPPAVSDNSVRLNCAFDIPYNRFRGL